MVDIDGDDERTPVAGSSTSLLDDEVDKSASHAGSASNNSALFHVVCVIAGTGILQIPYALSLSGWAGLAFMLFAAVVNDYTGKLLIRCLYHRGERIHGGYPEVGRLAFGAAGERCVLVFYNTVLLGVTCLYLVLAGMNLESLVGVLSQKQWIAVCAAGVLVPFVAMRTLKEVAIVSFFGALASVIVVVIVVVLGIAEYPKYAGRVSHAFFNPTSFPTALGTFSFSFGGNFVYAEVERSMATPEAFPSVLSQAMLIITSMYAVTAVVAYGTYGDLTVSPILSNLPAGAAATAAIVVITAHVLLACPLLLTTFSLDMERHLGLDGGEDTGKQQAGRGGLRVAIVVGVTLVAMTVPYFSDLMTFLGAVANTMLIFVFPVVFYFRIFGVRGRSVGELAFGALVVSVGVLGGAVGGYESLAALYRDVAGGE